MVGGGVEDEDERDGHDHPPDFGLVGGKLFDLHRPELFSLGYYNKLGSRY